MAWFRSHYKCYRCNEEWDDEWSSIVDDECGACGARHISAAETDDLTFVIDEEPHCFVVSRSSDAAEDAPEYTEVIRFLRRDFAEAYVRALPGSCIV